MPRIKITIPYTAKLSKNVALKRTRTGMAKSKATKAEQDRIHYMVKGAIHYAHSKPFIPGHKVWLKIVVYRPRDPAEKRTGDIDPINVLDTIADAVKGAIGVDDDVFSAVVDWRVEKENPRIEIIIEQEVE